MEIEVKDVNGWGELDKEIIYKKVKNMEELFKEGNMFRN